MFAGIFSCTPSFSPEINKVYLILSYLILNCSTSLKVISNLASLLFCSFGELLNETLDLCLHSCLLSAPYQLTHLEQIFCLICHTHSDTGVTPAKHLETFNCSQV